MCRSVRVWVGCTRVVGGGGLLRGVLLAVTQSLSRLWGADAPAAVLCYGYQHHNRGHAQVSGWKKGTIGPS